MFTSFSSMTIMHRNSGFYLHNMEQPYEKHPFNYAKLHPLCKQDHNMNN